MIAELIALLDDETAIYEEIATLADEEHRLLAVRDTPGLARLVAEQDRLAIDAATIERQRAALVARISGDPATTIDRIAATLPADEAAALRQRRERLLGTVLAIQLANARNTALLTALNDHVGGRVRLLSRRRTVYGKAGQAVLAAASGIVDRRA